jgi:murein DD-endopeptidase / murein LD-carboxypeptidase
MTARKKGERVAARALQQLDVPFRLHAALPGTALDCVGLVAHAAKISGMFEYQLRGDFTVQVSAHLKSSGYRLVKDDLLKAEAAFLPGDIVLVQTALRQQHLMIFSANGTAGGFVHAHAGLGRVVLMPLPSPWPIICGWRHRR